MSESANNDSSKATTANLVSPRDYDEEYSRRIKRQRRNLDWRMDAEESRSDFTIEIAVAGEDKGKGEPTAIQTYHVHKVILEFGIKASGYFGALFSSPTVESTFNKTRIHLEQNLAASAFPLLLDFMYGLDAGAPVLTMENAGPLYHLADYFEVESLRAEIIAFWKKHVQLDNLALCLKQATLFHIDSLRELVFEQCCAKIGEIAADSPLIDESDPSMWVDVLSKIYGKDGDINTVVPNPNVSILIAEFCFKHKDELDKKIFRMLAGDRFCPLELPHDSAIKILEAEKAIVSERDSDRLTVLQARCIIPLASDWKRLTESQNVLRHINPHLLSKIMTASLNRLGDENDALKEFVDGNKRPTSITVVGSMIKEFNGVFHISNDRQRQLAYVRSGFWEGKPVTFIVGLGTIHLTKTFVWSLGFLSPDGGWNVGFFAYAYKNEHIRECLPKTGWQYVHGRRAFTPAPDSLTCSYS